MTADGPVSEGGSKASGSGCGVVVGLIFALIGVGILIGAVKSVLYAMDVSSWTETPCRILSATLVESHSDDGTSYRADFTYAYRFDGQDYVGERDSVLETSGGRKSAKQRLANFPVGTETVCSVNPNDPDEAVLDASFPNWSVFAFSAFGLVFGGIGSAIAFVSFKAWREEKRKRAMLLGGGGGTDALSSGGDYFQTDVIDRDANPTRFAATTMTSGGLPKARGRGEHDLHPADVKDRKADVPQRLKAESSRLGALVAVSLIALFWNGVVSVFVWGLFFDQPGGVFNWFLGLFLIPFVLIGLLLIAGVVHSFISLFNPTISVALSSGAVSRGGSIDVAWEVSSGIRRIDHLRISVVGTEWARYQRGTDTIVDESTFEVVPVVSTDQADEISFGSGTVTIPPQTMHTLDQTNNKIKWAVVVSGVIAWWPDVSGSYPFRVTPHVVDEATGGPHA